MLLAQVCSCKCACAMNARRASVLARARPCKLSRKSARANALARVCARQCARAIAPVCSCESALVQVRQCACASVFARLFLRSCARALEQAMCSWKFGLAKVCSHKCARASELVQVPSCKRARASL